MNELEREMIAELIKLRAAAQNFYIPLSESGGKNAQKVLDEYSRLTLPYIGNKGNMKNVPNKSTDEWKAILAELNKNKS